MTFNFEKLYSIFQDKLTNFNKLCLQQFTVLSSLSQQLEQNNGCKEKVSYKNYIRIGN